jgi:putative (di)nucleoside polyphosphate hydrolase
MDLPYRPNVVVIPLIGDRFLVVGKPEWPEDSFKFPQGGIEPGEDLIEAAIREISEELGVGCEPIEISFVTNRYDWPHPVPPYRGQEQRFVAVRIKKDTPISPDNSEIACYRLVDRDTVLDWNERRAHRFSDYNGVISDVFDELGL